MVEVSLIVGITLGVILILCFVIGVILVVHGLFKTVEVGTGSPPIGEATVAYKLGQGPYKNCGQLFREAVQHAPSAKYLGIYYDDPARIPEDKLRYAVGVVLSEGGQVPDDALQQQLTSHGFKVANLPAVSSCVKATFPYRNILSIYMALWKVYPKLFGYIDEHGLSAHPHMEIYTSDTIQYMAPQSKHEQFIVPEALQCVPEEYQAQTRI